MKRLLSGLIRKLNEKSDIHKEGKLGFSKYWDYISLLGEKTGIIYANYKNINVLVETIALEERIDFEKANSERDSLIDEFDKKLKKERLE